MKRIFLPILCVFFLHITTLSKCNCTYFERYNGTILNKKRIIVFEEQKNILLKKQNRTKNEEELLLRIDICIKNKFISLCDKKHIIYLIEEVKHGQKNSL